MHNAGFYFSNGNGGECFLSKGYYNFTGGEFSKCEISQNLAYIGSHLVLVKNGFANAPNLSTRDILCTLAGGAKLP